MLQMQHVKQDWNSNMAEQRSNNRRGRDGRNQGAGREEKQFNEQVIHIDRVSRVVKGGRRFRFRALVVVGDGKGKVGIGVSKGSDVQMAVQKAVDVAKKAFIDVPLKNGTIPHISEARQSGADVMIKPAADGTGIIAGGTMRTVLEVAGVQNVVGKSLGSSNKVNVAYATLAALQVLLPRDQWVTTKNAPAEKSAKAEAK